MPLITALAAAVLLIPVVTLAGLTVPPHASPAASSLGASSSTSVRPSAPIPAAGAAGELRLPRARASGPAVAPSWNWPLLPVPRVLRGFQVGPEPWSPGHRGVDLSARPGAVVRAPADGVVRFASMLAGRPVLTIDHGNGLVSSFEPALSPLHPGAVVHRGDVVATVAAGENHCALQTCLHWGVRRNGRYLDPLSLLAIRHSPAVLLPLGSDSD